MNDIANIQIIIPLLSKAKTSPKTFGFPFHQSSASALAFFTHFSQCVCVLQLQILLSLLFSTPPLGRSIKNVTCFYAFTRGKRRRRIHSYQFFRSLQVTYQLTKSQGTRKLGLKGQGSKRSLFKT